MCYQKDTLPNRNKKKRSTDATPENSSSKRSTCPALGNHRLPSICHGSAATNATASQSQDMQQRHRRCIKTVLHACHCARCCGCHDRTQRRPTGLKAASITTSSKHGNETTTCVMAPYSSKEPRREKNLVFPSSVLLAAGTSSFSPKRVLCV